MATMQPLLIEFRPPWWLKLYLRSLVIFCATLGTEPDWGKVLQFVLRGCRIRVAGGRWRGLLDG
jgi:hypothetical protein